MLPSFPHLAVEKPRVRLGSLEIVIGMLVGDEFSRHTHLLNHFGGNFIVAYVDALHRSFDHRGDFIVDDHLGEI